MNRFLSIILTLVFTLSFVFASADLNVTKSVNPSEFNEGDTVEIIFNLNVPENITIRHNLDVMLTLDKSRSMSGQKLTDAQNAAIDFINQLDSEYDRVGLVGFSESSSKKNAKVYSPLTNIFITVIDEINNLDADSGTNTGDGIKKSNEELLKDNLNNIKIQILLSDGKPTYPDCGGFYSCQKDIDYALDQAQISADNNIIIYTISLGNDADQDFMQEIADITNGKHYYSYDSSDLEDIFNEIATEIQNLFAKNIYIYDKLLDNVSPAESFSDYDCNYNEETRIVTCYIDEINSNETKTISYKVNVYDYTLTELNLDTNIYYTDYNNELFDLVINPQPIVSITNLSPTAYDRDYNISEDENININRWFNDFGNFLPIYIESTNPEFGTLVEYVISDYPYDSNYPWIVKYIPNKNFFGEDYFIFTVKDFQDENLTSTATIKINVLPVNDSPILNDISDYSITQGKTLEFIITAEDIDSNELIFEILDANQFNWIDLNQVNNTSAKIILKPTTETTVKDYNISFIVKDDYNAQDSKTIKITVNKKQINSTGGGSGGSSSSNNTTVIGQCIPQIKYSEWSECINGKQTRTYEIVNFCENMFIGATERSCIMPKKDANIIIEDSNLIDQNISVNNDENTNLKSPVGLFTLGNGLFWGLIVLALLIIAYIVYRIIIARKNKPIVKKSKK